MAHGAFVRSPLPHAEVVAIDASRAMAAGAIAVLTARDLPLGKFLTRRGRGESLNSFSTQPGKMGAASLQVKTFPKKLNLNQTRLK